MSKKREINGNSNSYQAWKASVENNRLLETQDSIPEEILKAEPDLVAAPEESKKSPELEAAIEVIQEGGLQTLTPLQQRIFQMSVVQGMSLRAIGKELKVSHVTVKEHLDVIGKKLRALVDERL